MTTTALMCHNQNYKDNNSNNGSNKNDNLPLCPVARSGPWSALASFNDFRLGSPCAARGQFGDLFSETDREHPKHQKAIGYSCHLLGDSTGSH